MIKHIVHLKRWKFRSSKSQSLQNFKLARLRKKLFKLSLHLPGIKSDFNAFTKHVHSFNSFSISIHCSEIHWVLPNMGLGCDTVKRWRVFLPKELSQEERQIKTNKKNYIDIRTHWRQAQGTMRTQNKDAYRPQGSCCSGWRDDTKAARPGRPHKEARAPPPWENRDHSISSVFTLWTVKYTWISQLVRKKTFKLYLKSGWASEVPRTDDKGRLHPQDAPTLEWRPWDWLPPYVCIPGSSLLTLVLLKLYNFFNCQEHTFIKTHFLLQYHNQHFSLSLLCIQHLKSLGNCSWPSAAMQSIHSGILFSTARACDLDLYDAFKIDSISSRPGEESWERVLGKSACVF